MERHDSFQRLQYLQRIITAFDRGVDMILPFKVFVEGNTEYFQSIDIFQVLTITGNFVVCVQVVDACKLFCAENQRFGLLVVKYQIRVS